jgi:hypothetical protein
MNILIVLVLLANILLLSISLVAFYWVRRTKDEIKAFITPLPDGNASPLAQTADALSSVFARAITAQLKTSFMGAQSGAVRAEKAIAGDIAEDLLNAQSPIAGALLSSFPALKKTLRRNPQLIDLALSKLPGLIQPGSGGNHNPKPVDQARFKL